MLILSFLSAISQGSRQKHAHFCLQVKGLEAGSSRVTIKQPKMLRPDFRHATALQSGAPHSSRQ
jgi:hypothetical protein